MALSPYALVSLPELNAALQHDPDGGKQDDRKERIINRVSGLIEAYCGRQLVTRGNLTEYHSPCRIGQELRLAQYPLIAVTSVHEDPDWQSKLAANWYSSDTLLTVNVDYVALNDPDVQAKLLRIATTWAPGRRVIKVVYSAGYATTAAVDQAIKDVCLDWCKAIWHAEMRGEAGASGVTDSTGTVSYFPPVTMSQAREQALTNFVRRDCAPTWERAA